MSRIRIKNFGPIKEGLLENDGWLDIKKVTVFIGNQGSGKSTVAKVISTLTWLEKAINRGDVKISNIDVSAFMEFFEYQRIQNYFRDETEIEYVGDIIDVKYSKNHISISEIDGNLNTPKIMYVPSERNFLSAIENPYSIKYLPDTLRTFAEELINAQLALGSNELALPIGGLRYEFNRDKKTSYLIGENFKLNLLESSSGYQSFVPLYLVSMFLSDSLLTENALTKSQLTVEQSLEHDSEIGVILLNETLSDAEKEEKIRKINAKYFNACFINIVEEPEQNLFPSSQRQVLNSLLKFNADKPENKLIMTTHSPYIINFLSLAIQGGNLLKKIDEKYKKESVEWEEWAVLRQKLDKIVPIPSIITDFDVVIYQLDETNGTITKLPNYEGIPSDENYLNKFLAEGNKLFDSLLEIEEGL